MRPRGKAAVNIFSQYWSAFGASGSELPGGLQYGPIPEQEVGSSESQTMARDFCRYLPTSSVTVLKSIAERSI